MSRLAGSKGMSHADNLRKSTPNRSYSKGRPRYRSEQQVEITDDETRSEGPRSCRALPSNTDEMMVAKNRACPGLA